MTCMTFSQYAHWNQVKVWVRHACALEGCSISQATMRNQCSKLHVVYAITTILSLLINTSLCASTFEIVIYSCQFKQKCDCKLPIYKFACMQWCRWSDAGSMLLSKYSQRWNSHGGNHRSFMFRISQVVNFVMPCTLRIYINDDEEDDSEGTMTLATQLRYHSFSIIHTYIISVVPVPSLFSRWSNRDACHLAWWRVLVGTLNHCSGSMNLVGCGSHVASLWIITASVMDTYTRLTPNIIQKRRSRSSGRYPRQGLKTTILFGRFRVGQVLYREGVRHCYLWLGGDVQCW